MNCRKRFVVAPGAPVSLRRLDTGDTGALDDKGAAAVGLAKGIARLADLQERLYADDRWSVLLIFQAMDAAGKDSTIKHVMSGVNPQGCQVFSFKAPSSEELDHDFLWRSVKALPERGRIGIHNRSYYEEVLVTRVHPELLQRQRIPGLKVNKALWRDRFRAINELERHLVTSGTIVVKFFLHVSKDEQRKRLLARLDDPEKAWKFQAGDLGERERWREYQAAYEDVFRHTSTEHAPWYVIPADHKWFARYAVAEIIGDTLADLDFQSLRLSNAERAKLRRLIK